MNTPLVSIVCLCYNQKDFVQKTLASVFAQNYANIEIIVVDDCSTDDSQVIISEVLKSHPKVPFLALDQNIGNTGAFNKGLELVTGKYVIDLSCDDILYPNKISKQVAFFESQPHEVGVVYSDARFVNISGEELGFHFKGQSRIAPYQGDVYERIIDTYFVPTPTMMTRKAVFDELKGYDQTLAYEDYDFWIRSARNWQYAYQPEVLMDWVKHSSSFSNQWYQKGDRQLYSTYLVCKKIKLLNRSGEEKEALLNRLRFEIRQSVFSANHREAELFGELLSDVSSLSIMDQVLLSINRLRLNLSFIRRAYLAVRYSI